MPGNGEGSGNTPLLHTTVVEILGSGEISIACNPPHDIPIAATFAVSTLPDIATAGAAVFGNDPIECCQQLAGLSLLTRSLVAVFDLIEQANCQDNVSMRSNLVEEVFVLFGRVRTGTVAPQQDR